jgi:hypothetical protein
VHVWKSALVLLSYRVDLDGPSFTRITTVLSS